MAHRFEAGSCVACGRGTDTALAVEGEAEWHVAFLGVLGIPTDQAVDLAALTTGSQLGFAILGTHSKLPDGRFLKMYRVCVECVEKSGAHLPRPVPAVEGADLPAVRQP